MTTQQREIGSDFELVADDLVRTRPSPPPWESSSQGPLRYYESGRQALAAVEAWLRASGRSRLVVPEYLCDSMILPFHAHGWQIEPVPVNARLEVQPNDVAAATTPAEVTVILHAPYFGRDTDPEMARALSRAQAEGCLVITDDTHRSLSTPTPVGDFRVASLRKLLPVPDGAYASGLPEGHDDGQRALDTTLSDLRLQAMAQKTAHLKRSDPRRAHLDMFGRAETMVDSRTEPRAMSTTGQDLARHLDYTQIRQRRWSNAVALEEQLRSTEVTVINPPAPDVLPSHLVIRVPEPQKLRTFLIERDIFCPIHWPKSEILTDISWPQRFLSIPIDQRYGVGDMARVAEAVSVYFDAPDRSNPHAEGISRDQWQDDIASTDRTR